MEAQPCAVCREALPINRSRQVILLIRFGHLRDVAGSQTRRKGWSCRLYRLRKVLHSLAGSGHAGPRVMHQSSPESQNKEQQ